jgi:hypothetical protein
MNAALHPRYLPDLALSDFYLFGYLKRCPISRSFEGTEQLLEAVQAILEGSGKVAEQAVFLEWKNSLRQCIATNGEYTDQVKRKVMEE